MHKRSHRGVGSNQWADKVQVNTAAETEEFNARVRSSARLGDVQLGGGRRDRDRTSKLTNGLNLAMESHLALIASGTAPTREQLETSVRQLGQFEDAIMHEHSNTYGQALISAAYFFAHAKVDKNLDRKAATAGTPEHALKRSFKKLQADALGVKPNEFALEELAEILDTLTEAAKAQERGESVWHEGGEGEATLASRFAAASVLSSRNPEDSSLKQEMSALRNQLHERGALKINF